MVLRGLLPRRSRRPTVSEELRAALGTPPAWMYPLGLADGSTPPLLHHELPSVHRTRAAMMEPLVRETLASAGADASAIDIACSEGWFAHRLMDWGAKRVHGVDVREVNIHRAELVRDHYAMDPDRLTFDVADVLSLDPQTAGTFDVVLMIGLIYHLEDPIGALRVARALTRGACVVETQLTEQHAAITSGIGVTDEYEQLDASWAAKFEPAQDFHPIASHGGVISLVPNLAALVQAMEVVGFGDVRVLETPTGHNKQYVERHRAMVIGYA
jgi:tRNA (mo5U34)-methyltransferase